MDGFVQPLLPPSTLPPPLPRLLQGGEGLYKWRCDRGRSSPEFSSGRSTASPSSQLARTDASWSPSRDPTGAPLYLRLWTCWDLYAPVRRPSAFPTLRADMTRLLLSCLLLLVSTHTVSVRSATPVSSTAAARPHPSCALQTCAFTQSSSCSLTVSVCKRCRARTFTCVQQ